jgi:hypothetical protein
MSYFDPADRTQSVSRPLPKPRIRKNARDNWYGYLGTRRVIGFTNGPTETQQQQAERWLAERSAGGPTWPGEICYHFRKG